MSRHPIKAGNVSGFTLLEVLVALGVMGIVFAGLVQIGGVSAKSADAIETAILRQWGDEASARIYLGSLHAGVELEGESGGVVATRVISRSLGQDDRARLNAAGWELYTIRMTSSGAGQMVWEVETLLRTGAGEEGGSFQ